MATDQTERLDALKKSIIGQYANQYGKREVPGVPPGAQPKSPPPVEKEFNDIKGVGYQKDTRVKIKVPSNYLLGASAYLSDHGGIIFPYTPTINYEYSASYATQSPLHTNFAINFYQKSTVSPINITGKFTVENDNDAKFLIGTLSLLKALTKMKSGGAKNGDPDSGSPPPVCRLYAYGTDMIENLPVAITNLRVDLSDGVDYYSFYDSTGVKTTSVPVVQTITIVCQPMFSRNELLNFNVSGYLQNKLPGFI